LVAVTERTLEIGIRLAVGAQPREIRKQFLLEASLLCTVGGLCGLALGHFGARIIAYVLAWPVEFNSTMAALAVACSSLIGVIFGIFPAQRAAHLDPAAILRSAR